MFRRIFPQRRTTLHEAVMDEVASLCRGRQVERLGLSPHLMPSLLAE